MFGSSLKEIIKNWQLYNLYPLNWRRKRWQGLIEFHFRSVFFSSFATCLSKLKGHFLSSSGISVSTLRWQSLFHFSWLWHYSLQLCHMKWKESNRAAETVYHSALHLNQRRVRQPGTNLVHRHQIGSWSGGANSWLILWQNVWSYASRYCCLVLEYTE